MSTLKCKALFSPTKPSISFKMTSMCYLKSLLAAKNPPNSATWSSKPKTCSISDPKERKFLAFSFSPGSKEERTYPSLLNHSLKISLLKTESSSPWNHPSRTFSSGITKTSMPLIPSWSSNVLWKSWHFSSILKIQISWLLVQLMAKL